MDNYECSQINQKEFKFNSKILDHLLKEAKINLPLNLQFSFLNLLRNLLPNSLSN